MDSVHEALRNFVVDYCEYLPPRIPRMYKPPTPTEFLTNYVMTSLPFTIRLRPYEDPYFDAVILWKSKKYLRKMMDDMMVTVAVTPNGRADAVVNDLFMLPEERIMTFDKFLDEIEKDKTDAVFYLQKQNNNLIEEFSPLVRDVKTEIPWASEAFGCSPDAANIWMGDRRSITSMHKDHYENIYYVICGWKCFELYPPIAMGWLPYKKYKKYQWYYRDNDWKMKDLNSEIKWIPNDRTPETQQKHLMYSSTKSYTVDVRPGEALYIPALWYHEVRQSRFCIAVNYWYDMKFDVKVPLLRFYNKLSKLSVSRRDATVVRQHELEDSLRVDLTDAFLKRNNVNFPKGYPL